MQTFVSSKYFLLIFEIGQFAFVTYGLTSDADGFENLTAYGVVAPCSGEDASLLPSPLAIEFLFRLRK